MILVSDFSFLVFFRFLREFKQRLVDCSSQGWHDKTSTSERFELYRELKQTLEYEGYNHVLASSQSIFRLNSTIHTGS